MLAEDDRIPVDAYLIQCDDLQTDESLLTGESVPLRKLAAGVETRLRAGLLGGDDLPFVFSGSMVVRGTAIGEVTGTGQNSAKLVRSDNRSLRWKQRHRGYKWNHDGS